MRKWFIILLLFLPGISAVSGQARLPAIAFDRISKDLGRITQGEPARHVFSFSNKGNGTLKILGIETS